MFPIKQALHYDVKQAAIRLAIYCEVIPKVGIKLLLHKMGWGGKQKHLNTTVSESIRKKCHLHSAFLYYLFLLMFSWLGPSYL